MKWRLRADGIELLSITLQDTEEERFELIRQSKGSHEVWYNSERSIKVVLVRNIKNRHAANSILKDAVLNNSSKNPARYQQIPAKTSA